MNSGITETITDDFCGSWSDPCDFHGPVARLVADETLPLGVDPDDPRVAVIIEKCRRAAGPECPAAIAVDQPHGWCRACAHDKRRVSDVEPWPCSHCCHISRGSACHWVGKNTIDKELR